MNCFVTGTPLYIDPMPNAYTVTNCISSTDTGYDAKQWCDKLNVEARANGWSKWAIGKTGYPELKFLTPGGLVVFVE